MIDKRDEFSKKKSQAFFNLYFLHITRDYLTYGMKNFLKATKHFLNDSIDDIIFGL